MEDNETDAVMTSSLPEEGIGIEDEASFLSVEDILKQCDEELHKLFPTQNPNSSLPEYTHCEYCNTTKEELDILFHSGVCIPSDFSSYMPVIYQMYAMIFVLALFGNALVLYIVATSRKMHTVTNLFIANLAVGDLLIMVFCVPFSVASIIVLQYWPFGEGLCIFVNYSQAISIFVSAYTLVAISVDRYLAIIYPLRPRMTRLQAKVIIAVVWGLALLTTLPIAIFSGLDSIDSRIYQSYGLEVCREQWPNEDLRKYYTMTLMVLQYFLPLLVLIFTYSRIAWKVWGCQGSTTARHYRPNSPVEHKNKDAARSLLRKSTSDHSPAKMIRLTLTVVLVYSLCWLPFNVLIAVQDFWPEAMYWPHFPHIWFVFHWLAMSHTCYNPVILCWMNNKFREGYLNVLYRTMPCCRSRISQWLLKARSSAGFHRAYTYSTTLPNSRTSRNNRSSGEDNQRSRKHSSCSTAGFIHLSQNVEVPLQVYRTCSLEPCSLPSSAQERENCEESKGLVLHSGDVEVQMSPSRGKQALENGGKHHRSRTNFLEPPSLHYSVRLSHSCDSNV